MKLIVGLGNPGDKYKNTRHNVGFMALNFILGYDGYITARPSHEFKSEMFTWTPPVDASEHGENKIIFLKPQTYMNDSGQALQDICNFYKLDLEKDLLVIHDEIDLPFGSMRLSKDSAAAGHNGVKSIIENLGTQNFNRLRVGIEARTSREEKPTDVFVLENFTEAESATLQNDVFIKIKDVVEEFIKN